MNHQELRDSLFLLRDGELADAQKPQALAHLEQCPDCRTDYERWELLSKTFFKAPKNPSAEETERFVRRVMNRLEALEPKQKETSGVLWWAGLRWMAPALSFGVAVFLVSFALSGPESATPMDDLLLMDANASSRSVQELVLPPGPAHAEDMLAFIGADK